MIKNKTTPNGMRLFFIDKMFTVTIVKKNRFSHASKGLKSLTIADLP
jgi:hypothetical protein